MSTTSSTSPTSPFERRDIRSAGRPFKRDKDHGSKWAVGLRPGAGVSIDWRHDGYTEEMKAGSESQKKTLRPRKRPSESYSDSKDHSNKTPKPFNGRSYVMGRQQSRIASQIEAHFETCDTSSTLSRSLLELAPSHINNINSQVTTIIAQPDSEILYSFDNKGPSPSERGRKVELESLVEKAEKKWVNEQTEKIVRGEYEVLDGEGEIVVKKGKRSPKQKVVATLKSQNASSRVEAEDDDGFELI